MDYLILLMVVSFSLGIHANYKDNTIQEHPGWTKTIADMKICKEKFGLPTDQESRSQAKQSCYYHCLVQRTGLMDDDGAITLELFKKYHPIIPKDLIETHIECIEASEDYDDKCEKAKKIQMCLRQKFEKRMENFNKAKKECMEEFDIPETRKWSPIPDDKKCFFKCIGVKMGAMNNAGDFTIEKFKVENPKAPEGMLRNVEQCMKTSKMDEACNSAKALSECIKKRSQWS